VSVSLKTILEDFVHEYAVGRKGVCTSAGSTTTAIDVVNFGGPFSGGTWPNGSPIRFTSGSGVVGENTYKAGLDTSTGTLTLNPAVASVPNGATFVISRDVDHIDRIIEACQRCLTRRASRWMKVPLTDVPDGDFLGSTVSDHWTASNATVVYTELSMVNGYAQNALRVTTSSGNGYAGSDNIPVIAGSTRQGTSFMRNANATPGTSNTAKLVLMDQTNNAVITPTFTVGAASTTSHSHVNIAYTYQVPATCSQVQYRLSGVESGAVVEFGPVIDAEVGQQVYNGQPHFLTTDDFGALYTVRFPSVLSGPEGNIFTPVVSDGITLDSHSYGISFDFQNMPYPGFPVFYDEYSFYPSISADTDTTDCPEELVIKGMAVELFSMLASSSREVQVSRYGRHIPTHWELLRDQAKADWMEPRVTRLRAERRVRIARAASGMAYG